MSTHKHIDRICVAAIVISLVITVLFMNGSALGVQSVSRETGYESRLFSTDRVHTIDIVMDDWDTFISNAQSEEYSLCSVVIDGEAVKNVGIRGKGNTSLSNVASMGSERYSFKIEFDHYEDAKNYYGLDKLCLNNIIQDNTYMKDYLTYQMMNEFGVSSPLCSFAYITVNGEDWGLYLAVEAVEESFLERNYGSDYGQLYKPDSQSFGAGRGNGKEFHMSEFDGFDKTDDAVTSGGAIDERMPMDGMKPPGDTDTSDDTDASDERKLPDDGEKPGGRMPMDNRTKSGGAIQTGPQDDNKKMDEMPDAQERPDEPEGPGSGQNGSEDVKLQYIDDSTDSYPNIFDNAKTTAKKSDKKRLIASLKQLSEYENLDEVVNTDEVLRYFVVHNFVVNGDSYTGNMIHNYYLYEKDGQMSMIPWDYNLAFGTFQGGSADSAVNDAIDEVLSDRPMQAWIFSDDSYEQQYRELYAQMLDEIDIQAIIDQAYELIAPYVAKDPTAFCTEEEFETGVQTLKKFCSLRAQSVRLQLSGSDETVDAGDLNLSDMGTMGSGGGPVNQSDKQTPENGAI